MRTKLGRGTPGRPLQEEGLGCSWDKRAQGSPCDRWKCGSPSAFLRGIED